MLDVREKLPASRLILIWPAVFGSGFLLWWAITALPVDGLARAGLQLGALVIWVVVAVRLIRGLFA